MDIGLVDFPLARLQTEEQHMLKKTVLLLTTVLMLSGIEVAFAQECEDNEKCAKDEYCQKDVGDCDGGGKCVPRPEMCLDVWKPVCGCDGKTYSNTCYAAREGVNVDYEGECKEEGKEERGKPCQTNFDCGFFWIKKLGFAQYCKKDIGDCDGEGVCAFRPEACLDVWNPVCGCDGNTYSNACYAALHGVSLDYGDACGSTRETCESNADCGFREYCRKAVGDCDGEGVCAMRPRWCLDYWIPVCGCDGRHYSNECYAARAGMNVAYMGYCPW